jgi:hypothetical protein
LNPKPPRAGPPARQAAKKSHEVGAGQRVGLKQRKSREVVKKVMKWELGKATPLRGVVAEMSCAHNSEIRPDWAWSRPRVDSSENLLNWLVEFAYSV